MSDKQEIAYSHTLSEYPKELQKKVTLLQHFRSYLEGDSNNAGGMATSSEMKNFDKNTNIGNTEEINMSEDSLKKINNYVYVKKCICLEATKKKPIHLHLQKFLSWQEVYLNSFYLKTGYFILYLKMPERT
jgi:hypothetical protein